VFGIVKKLYDWVLSWYNSRWAVPFLSGLSFSEAIFFPVPPDVLLIALCLGNPSRSFFFAFITSLFSVLGGIGGYLIGHFFWEATQNFFFSYVFSPEAFQKVSDLYNQNAFWAVFLAGFTPIPYKVFTVSAGVFSINFPIFVFASAISRSMRFFLLATLIFFFGERVKEFIEKYFNILTIVFSILLVGGFFLLKLLR